MVRQVFLVVPLWAVSVPVATLITTAVMAALLELGVREVVEQRALAQTEGLELLQEVQLGRLHPFHLASWPAEAAALALHLLLFKAVSEADQGVLVCRQDLA